MMMRMMMTMTTVCRHAEERAAYMDNKSRAAPFLGPTLDPSMG